VILLFQVTTFGGASVYAETIPGKLYLNADSFTIPSSDPAYVVLSGTVEEYLSYNYVNIIWTLPDGTELPLSISISSSGSFNVSLLELDDYAQGGTYFVEASYIYQIFEPVSFVVIKTTTGDPVTPSPAPNPTQEPSGAKIDYTDYFPVPPPCTVYDSYWENDIQYLIGKTCSEVNDSTNGKYVSIRPGFTYTSYEYRSNACDPYRIYEHSDGTVAYIYGVEPRCSSYPYDAKLVFPDGKTIDLWFYCDKWGFFDAAGFGNVWPCSGEAGPVDEQEDLGKEGVEPEPETTEETTDETTEDEFNLEETQDSTGEFQTVDETGDKVVEEKDEIYDDFLDAEAGEPEADTTEDSTRSFPAEFGEGIWAPPVSVDISFIEPGDSDIDIEKTLENFERALDRAVEKIKSGELELDPTKYPVPFDTPGDFDLDLDDSGGGETKATRELRPIHQTDSSAFDFPELRNDMRDNFIDVIEKVWEENNPSLLENNKIKSSTLPKPDYKEVSQVPISGQIVDYIRGEPVEIKIFKPDGTIESMGAIAKRSGEFAAQMAFDHNSPEGKYLIEVRYDSKTIDLFTIQIIAEKVPDWIKSNAGWWADGSIDDETFIAAIQYMIREGIIVMTGTPQTVDTASQEIPDWIKKNAGWWADGITSDSEFVNGIKFMIENGIIKV